MSAQTRALLIGMFGPALQAVGLLWVLLNALVNQPHLTFRYVIFEPAFLVIAVGILLSAVCIPLALQVAVASPEEVELELFETRPAEAPGQSPAQAPADAPGRTWGPAK